MKTKYLALSFITLTILLFTSCKNDVKKELKTKQKTYSLVPKTTVVNWTAYKTTEKVAVKGEFKEINVKEINGNTAKEALNGLEFSIPISSLFTNNEDRDNKLKKFFFGMMDTTEILSGKLILDSDTTGKVEVKMNGVVNSFPIEYTISGQLVTFNGTLDINNWNAQSALESLNKVCFELHKGSDGVSKTWSEVAINVSTYLKVEN